MKSIATLTVNPTIDLTYEVDRVVPTIKMRAGNEHYAPGGGGINVARVFVRLGGNARCYYLSGGATGPAFDGLVDLHQLVHTRIAIEQATRVATAVFERESGQEYRFTPAGPEVSETEWRRCLETLGNADCDIMVMSGSLPPGVPRDFYARVSAVMRDRGIETVLDSSGDALSEGVAAGGHLLVKPNLVELSQLAGRDLQTNEEVEEVATSLVDRGLAKLVAVTIGDRGAGLTSAAGTTFIPAIEMEAKSTIGAGDSFLAAMVHRLARGDDPVDAFRFGMAAGSAAVLTPGTDLAYPPDIERMSSLLAG